MTEVAPAFLEEAQALAAVLAPLDDEAWRTTTTFKNWSFDHIVQHSAWYGPSCTDGAARSRCL